MSTWIELAEGRTPETCKTLGRFMRYHDKNPDLLPRLEQVVKEQLETHDVYSVYPAIDSVIRWKESMYLEDPEKRFRIPNDFKPWYLRMVLFNHPEWVGRLEIRTLFCCGGQEPSDDPPVVDMPFVEASVNSDPTSQEGYWD